MADGITFKIDSSKFEALLKAMPQRVARRAVRNALKAGGAVLLEAMKAECPVRTDAPTPGSDALPPGILKADLTTTVQVNTKYPPRVIVGPTSDTAYVAWWIEQGFDHYGGGRKGKGTKGKHVDANPFLTRAFDSSIQSAVDAMISSLSTSLEQDLTSETGSSNEAE